MLYDNNIYYIILYKDKKYIRKSTNEHLVRCEFIMSSGHLAIQLLVSCKNEYLKYSYTDITYNRFILKPCAVSFLLPELGHGTPDGKQLFEHICTVNPSLTMLLFSDLSSLQHCVCLHLRYVSNIQTWLHLDER